MFKRKIYDKMLEWKRDSNGKTALLIEGARRVGKSTVAEEFARKEYESYILIDFSQASKETRSLFDDISDINYLFLQLQLQYKTDLHERKSVIIFDEVQFCPMARQAIKFLVQDYRYDYIETGSLISIRKNVKDILIPSEERKISMYPMDYEEFLWAVGDNKVRISELCIEHTDLKSDSRNNDKDHKFYTAMLDGLGGILSSAFKDNEFLEFAVITGCLRIAKESIFTGTNNFASYSVLDEDFSEYFGFSEDEVEEILIAADQKDKAALKKRKNAKPKNYWKYTSHNSVLLTFVERTDFDMAEKFETLLNGGTVTERISDELTHDTLHASEDNLWSVLLMTGYITKTSPGEEGEAVCLRIPNREIASVMEHHQLQ